MWCVLVDLKCVTKLALPNKAKASVESEREHSVRATKASAIREVCYLRRYIYTRMRVSNRKNDRTCYTSTQDIYFEEERHQQAIMALESSVLGCGSDDWSVDSDYAFQDFADDVKHNQQRQNHTNEQLQQSSPERSPPDPGTPSSFHATGDPINNLNKGSMRNVHDHVDAAAETAVVTRTPAGGGAIRGEVLPPGKVASAGGEAREDTPAGSGRDGPRMCNARLLGDPGSSTDSAHIMRLEQRMFLKVG